MFTRWETRLFGFVLILLTINASAKIDSVLEVIPNTAVGLIHVGNLKGFNQEVGDLMAQMDPTSDPDTDVLVAILASMFSANSSDLLVIPLGDTFILQPRRVSCVEFNNSCANAGL